MTLTPRRLIGTLAGVLLLAVPVVHADQWNDRIDLTFSTPVMIPGATLPAGTYTFSLVNSRANRHLVQVRNTAGDVRLAQAVPIKRAEASGDTVLQFNPTDAAAPPAIKSWFYPGSRYGHEFIYSDEQARHIAERTKTIVLSVDVPGTDLEAGMLRVYDASGRRTPWQGDEATLREWDAWRRASTAEPDEVTRATAPIVSGGFQGTRVSLDELESNPSKLMGKRISVDAEIEEIYGPRLFTIDEPSWGDLDGEILVLMSTPLAALVKDNDRVTITGTVKPFVRTEVEREWGWFGLDRDLEIEVGRKPVLVAERLVGGDNNVALIIDTTPAGERAVATGGLAPLTSPQTIANGDDRLVGRHTTLSNVKVAGNPPGSGFFVTLGERQVFVLPSQQKTTVAAGDTVGVSGVILQMPRGMMSKLKAPATANTDIYIFANRLQK
jgi:hypothetical protein